ARVVVKFLKSLFSQFGTPKAIISDRGTHFYNDQFSRVMAKYGVTHCLSTTYHPQTSRHVEVTNHGLKRILERTVGENRTLWSDKLEDALWAFRTAFKTFVGCTPYRLKIFSGKLKSRWSGPFTIFEVYPYGTTKLIHPDGYNFKVNCHRLKHYQGGDPPPLEILDLPVINANSLAYDKASGNKFVLIVLNDGHASFLGYTVDGTHPRAVRYGVASIFDEIGSSSIAIKASASSKTGSKDRPPMLAPGNYIQWKSRINRYIDTKPNQEHIHYCLKNPPYELGWKDKFINDAEGNPTTATHQVFETYQNVKQVIRNQLNAEAEAVQIILTGIDNDIYSKVDACPNACEMWKAIGSRANQDNSPRIHRNVGYEGQRSGTVAGARNTVGSSMVQKSGIQCYNCKEYGHIAR
nr:reverse transcriptase domain-containing protein [Tanacetum cinerariifolium]